MKSFIATARLTPSELFYLERYPSISEGIRAVIRESMKANLAQEELDFFELLDDARRKKRGVPED